MKMASAADKSTVDAFPLAAVGQHGDALHECMRVHWEVFAGCRTEVQWWR